MCSLHCQPLVTPPAPSLLCCCLAPQQALTTPTFKGVTLDASAFAPVNSTVTGHGHHYEHYRRKYWGPRHDHNDHHYWHERHHHKSEFLDCLKSAVALYQPGNPVSLDPAVKKLAWCIKEHFDRCHDQ